MRELGYGFGFDGFVTYGTNLVFATVFGTGGIFVNDPFTVGMRELGYGFGFDGFVANGTNLVLTAVFGTGSFFVCDPFAIGVSECVAYAFVAFQTFLRCRAICFGKFFVLTFA